MKVSRRVFLVFLIAAFILSDYASVLGQEQGIGRYQYYSPKQNSTGLNPETEIVIRYGKQIDANTISDESLQVSGEFSGKHTGRFTLSKDQLTLIFKPDQYFSPAEKVSVQLKVGIKTRAGEDLPLFGYTFKIRQKLYGDFNQELFENSGIQTKSAINAGNTDSGSGNAISYTDIPPPTIIYSKGATPDNIMTVLEKQPNDYLYLFNNKGTLLFAKKTPHKVSNFKPHSTGIASYFDHVIKGHIVIDSLLNPVDTLFMKNGYKPDAHDVLMLANGHIILEAYDPQLVDMSVVVEGGNPAATVVGLVIQELDQNRDLVFEWRSWDHFKITDTYNYLLASLVEYVHCNSLDADTDSTLIFSSRNLSEITKINRSTGDIMWRLGGKNNEFVFQNDTRGFSAQHSVMKQKNGSLTIFDNGNGFEPIYSRGIEYKIDELYKTVNLTAEYRLDPDVFAYVTGNLQRLDNENTFIFWGSILSETGHIITEYDPYGKLTFKARFDPLFYPTYAAYRTKWDHSVFSLGSDTINFVDVVQGDSVYHDVNVINHTNRTVTLTSALGNDRGFKIQNLPLLIAPLGSVALGVQFCPKSSGSFSDVLTLYQETDSSVIGRQMVVFGKSVIKTGIYDERVSDIEIFPNPVKKILEIKSSKIIDCISIYDLSGRILKTLHNPGYIYTIDIESFDYGFYILVATFSDKTKSVQRIIKQ